MGENATTPVTDGAVETAADGSEVTVDTHGDGYLTIMVDGESSLTLSLDAARALLPLLGYAVVVGK